MKIEEIRQTIQNLVEPILEEHGAFLVDMHIRSEHRLFNVQIFVDTDAGITIDQCAALSREISRQLEDRQPLEGAEYRLEISSPGIDKPIRLLRQYQKNIGRRFETKYSDGIQTLSVKGTLTSVEGDRITFQAENGESISVFFHQIIESKEELPW